jgi:hypothetical protein
MLAAILFRLPLTHCVDDVICFEEDSVADSGKKAWDTLMELTGWLMSVDKDISPCFRFAVIGVAINLAVMPEEWPYIYIMQKRLEALEDFLQRILKLYKHVQAGLWRGGIARWQARLLTFVQLWQVWQVQIETNHGTRLLAKNNTLKAPLCVYQVVAHVSHAL